MRRSDGRVEPGARVASWHRGDFARYRDLVLATDPWPETVGDTLRLTATFRFLWRDPDGAEPLADQLSGHQTPDGVLWSSCTLMLARRTSAMPEFWFPWPYGDPRLRDLVRLCAPDLPFPLRASAFRRAVPRKSGVGYREIRFDATGLVEA